MAAQRIKVKPIVNPRREQPQGIAEVELEGLNVGCSSMVESNIFGRNRIKRYICEKFMISEQIKKIIPKIKEYLSTQPIKRAWIFGSCSRGEERPDSDIDLLVVYDHSQRISLLKVCRIINDLEDITGRRIDMVEEGYLMPFAQPSAERDRFLVFER